MWVGREEKIEGEEEGKREWWKETRGNWIVETGKNRDREQRNILIAGAFMGLTRKLPLKKFPGIH